MKRNEVSLSNWKLHYEADKKLDITQAIFISNSLMARTFARFRKWVGAVVRTRANRKRVLKV